MKLLLYPNQLFTVNIIEETLKKNNINISYIDEILFIEHPLYFGFRPNSETTITYLSLNKLRLLFMFVIHHYYIEYLNKSYKKNKIKITYISYDNFDKKLFYEKANKHNIIYIDTCDKLLDNELKLNIKNKNKNNLYIYDSPSFYLSSEDIQLYINKKNGKQMSHYHFFNYIKNKMSILENVKSYDKENRETYKSSIPYPPHQYSISYSSSKIWTEKWNFINKHSNFKNNYEPYDNINTIIKDYLIKLPLTYNDVKKWLQLFVKQRLENYGKYQDIIISDNSLLYHSGLSIYMNNGLITPQEIVNEILKVKDNYPINSIEGFIRQILGWREYCRVYYYYVSPKIYRKNYFSMTSINSKHNKYILDKIYKAQTYSHMINITIKKAFNYGYINHIERLMMISNYMTLNQLHPDAIYKWMYEFSLDSYEWVMIFNCYSMGSYSDGGFAMSKPYISSINYLEKMSNYKPNKEICNMLKNNKVAYKKYLNKNPKTNIRCEFNLLYEKFKIDKKKQLKKTQLANIVK